MAYCTFERLRKVEIVILAINMGLYIFLFKQIRRGVKYNGSLASTDGQRCVFNSASFLQTQYYNKAARSIKEQYQQIRSL